MVKAYLVKLNQLKKFNQFLKTAFSITISD